MKQTSLTSTSMCTETALVISKTSEFEGCTTLRVAVKKNTSRSSLPGQFYMLYAFGVGEIPISISRKLCSSIIEFTIKAVGLVSEALCNTAVGDFIGARGPFGTGWPLAKFRDQPLLLLAGGLGLAPLRSLIYALTETTPSRHSRDLLFGARSPNRVPFREELTDLPQSTNLAIQIIVESNCESSDQEKLDLGIVTDLLDSHYDPMTIAIICGPEVMLKAASCALAARGILPNNVYLSLERNMHCALGVCGRCQFGPYFICRDGPVLRYDQVGEILAIGEL